MPWALLKLPPEMSYSHRNAMVTQYVLQPLLGRWMDQEGLFSGIKKESYFKPT